jgi:NAD kinase
MFALKPSARTTRSPRFEKVVIVTRMTQLEELLARFNTTAQARFYLEHAGEAFEPIEKAHAQYHKVLDTVRALVPRGVKSIVIERGMLPQFQFDASDLVVAVGQDGLVVNIAKYLDGQPILAVNPMPDTFDGVLLPFDITSVRAGIDTTLYHDVVEKRISMAEAQLNDGQSLLAFNDFFVGASSHVSARYEIRSGKKREFHSSSGIIISTGAGSTGWLQSVYAGAAGVIKALGGQVVPPANHGRLDWEADQLIYAVREPFPSKHSQASMVYGTITTNQPLVIRSHMAEHGVIFSDGVEQDYVAFNRGTAATIRLARRKTRLIVRT